MTEIRVRVTRDDINRAYDDAGYFNPEYSCPMAQALIRLGYLGVEVVGSDYVYIGMDRYAAISEAPEGERLWQLIDEFDSSNDLEREPEPAEFVLRRVGAR